MCFPSAEAFAGPADDMPAENRHKGRIMANRYNIVLYFSDQQRFDTCGCYGQKLDITPNLDCMAEEGTVFENAFSPQPVCGPFRAMLQTGKYPTETGCFRNNKMLPIDAKTVANYMEGAGYETAYVGKWHLASEGELEKDPSIDFQRKAIPPHLRGGYTGFWRVSDVLEFTSDGYSGYVFDENMNRCDFKGYRTDCITDYALEYLRSYDGKKPFFLTVSHIEPHHQNNAHHYQGPEGSKERFKDYEVPADLAAFPNGDWKEEYPDYLGACNAIDHNLGRIIAELKERGLYDNTVIIFTSDHGSHFRTRNTDSHFCGYDDYKRSCHEAAIHIPLVITGGPFRTGGKRVSDLVSTISLPKTIVELAGYQLAGCMEGENLADFAAGEVDADRRNEVFVQISESRVGRCIRTDKWKYAVSGPGLNGGLYMGSPVYQDDFLYNLDDDPSELDYLVDDEEYAEVKANLRKRLKEMIKDAEGIDVRFID